MNIFHFLQASSFSVCRICFSKQELGSLAWTILISRRQNCSHPAPERHHNPAGLQPFHKCFTLQRHSSSHATFQAVVLHGERTGHLHSQTQERLGNGKLHLVCGIPLQRFSQVGGGASRATSISGEGCRLFCTCDGVWGQSLWDIGDSNTTG